MKQLVTAGTLYTKRPWLQLMNQLLQSLYLTAICLFVSSDSMVCSLYRIDMSKESFLKSRFLIFRSFIQSNFNCCPLVWHFCNKANTEQLEKLQYRALRIVFSDFTSSYASLLEKADLSTLHLNRLRRIAAETYKCINNLTPENIKRPCTT